LKTNINELSIERTSKLTKDEERVTSSKRETGILRRKNKKISEVPVRESASERDEESKEHLELQDQKEKQEF
jgi:hypothetical protein